MTTSSMQSEGGLFLLPGSSRLIELEHTLSTTSFDHQFSTVFWGAFRHMLLQLARRYQLDYILVDCAPNYGMLNKVVCMPYRS